MYEILIYYNYFISIIPCVNAVPLSYRDLQGATKIDLFKLIQLFSKECKYFLSVFK